MRDDTEAHDRGLLELMESAAGVIFDFDGPMCQLFPDGTAATAEDIRRALREDGLDIPLAMTNLSDSHDMLQELRQDTSATAKLVVDLVTKAEFRAARTARRAAHVETVVSRLAAQGKLLAIASNNDAGAITEFLRLRGLAPFFTDRVFGRDAHALHTMKPAPHSVLRALNAMGLAPRSCLMIGDKVSDLEAARAAGTSFLGCTEDTTERDMMLKLGADAVVASLEPVSTRTRSPASNGA